MSRTQTAYVFKFQNCCCIFHVKNILVRIASIILARVCCVVRFGLFSHSGYFSVRLYVSGSKSNPSLKSDQHAQVAHLYLRISRLVGT